MIILPLIHISCSLTYTLQQHHADTSMKDLTINCSNSSSTFHFTLNNTNFPSSVSVSHSLTAWSKISTVSSSNAADYLIIRSNGKVFPRTTASALSSNLRTSFLTEQYNIAPVFRKNIEVAQVTWSLTQFVVTHCMMSSYIIQVKDGRHNSRLDYLHN